MYALDITAVVTMFDSGGSTGILRDEFGVLPPGDVRRCILALSDGPRAEILRKLFAYRFDVGKLGANGGGRGHSFGNLLLVALTSIYGSDIEGIKKASELLDIQGRVLPVSLDKAQLVATLENGEEVIGEGNIDEPKHDGALHITGLKLQPAAALFDETRDAITDAALVVICPGDLYTSIIPNLVVDGMREALQESNAQKICIVPLMSKWGETHGFKASDAVKELLQYSGSQKFDHVICNTTKPDAGQLDAYAKEKQWPIEFDADALSKYTDNVITGDFSSESDLARHDSDKLAKVIADL